MIPFVPLIPSSFQIGREKNPANSEVARLIQQSIEQDRRRAEARRIQDEERMREQDMLMRELERQQDMGSPQV